MLSVFNRPCVNPKPKRTQKFKFKQINSDPYQRLNNIFTFTLPFSNKIQSSVSDLREQPYEAIFVSQVNIREVFLEINH